MTTDANDLALDIDLRMVGVWGEVGRWEAELAPMLEDDESRTLFAALLRMSYGRGYLDALQEDTAGRRGELTASHGYATP